jgi:predicted CoA-binding protein
VFVNPPPEQITELLRRASIIAVVGLSADPTRPSHGVARALQRFGYRIIPVTPAAETILGEVAVASLAQLREVLASDEHVDIVDVFRRPQYVAGSSLSAFASSSRRCGCRRGSSMKRRPRAPGRRASSRSWTAASSRLGRRCASESRRAGRCRRARPVTPLPEGVG